ncbi:MAG TPA: PA14 domain-containing protein [Tepidisphaeraceae bacterium]|jgi:hypothetical protein|nr:PA14 domain-containing protein [Tepidisphaeraceae bacterium]
MIRPLLLLALFALPAAAAETSSFPVHKDWSWVQGCVFVPTNCTNEAQQWDQYDPAINDRELHYASLYGINTVRVYLHYFIYLKDKTKLLNNIEDFLTRADKYHIKTEFVFFDDCWHEPSPDILKSDYQYPAPVPGVHNSRWLLSPGHDVLNHYNENRDRLQSYVQDIVNAHKSDPRIIFWETYNEPKEGPNVHHLMKDSQQWIHETGSTIPVTATGLPQFTGDPYSDFHTWHNYTDKYQLSGDQFSLNTECMNRQTQSVPGIVEHFKGKTGFILWEFGIGRDNCRYAWKDKPESPAKSEPQKPFHGLVYPDGHPWSISDIQSLMGSAAFAKIPLFKAEYFKDDRFADLAKTSVTPFVDFDLPDEPGAGSPDASAGVPFQHFSLRYTATIAAPATGKYTITADTAGSGTATVSFESSFGDCATLPPSNQLQLDLAAGERHTLTIQYSHPTGPTHLHLTWSSPTTPLQLVTPVAP